MQFTGKPRSGCGFGSKFSHAFFCVRRRWRGCYQHSAQPCTRTDTGTAASFEWAAASRR